MKVICDYCGKQVRFVDSSIVYGRHYGKIYYCPDCEAWVGVHKGTDKPLGRLANAELRKQKKIAHAVFDTLWRGKLNGRKRAYKWLAEHMGLPIEKTHIGLFDVDQCKQVIDICQKLKGENKHV